MQGERRGVSRAKSVRTSPFPSVPAPHVGQGPRSQVSARARPLSVRTDKLVFNDKSTTLVDGYKPLKKTAKEVLLLTPIPPVRSVTVSVPQVKELDLQLGMRHAACSRFPLVCVMSIPLRIQQILAARNARALARARHPVVRAGRRTGAALGRTVLSIAGLPDRSQM